MSWLAMAGLLIFYVDQRMLYELMFMYTVRRSQGTVHSLLIMHGPMAA
jgi:hypothetical protein